MLARDHQPIIGLLQPRFTSRQKGCLGFENENQFRIRDVQCHFGGNPTYYKGCVALSQHSSDDIIVMQGINNCIESRWLTSET